MARARGKLQRFNFSKGWNTEANPMTFPENTAQDLENVVLDIDGSIRRRLGVSIKDESFATFFEDTQAIYETTAIGFAKWENVNGSGDLNFLISQKGTNLHFSIEDGTVVDTLDFSSTIITGKAVEATKEVLEFASGLGYLFCTGPYTEPFYVTYDADAGTVSLTEINIKIRDFEGVDDGYAVDERPGVLTNLHEYNLRNQGWVDSFDCAVNGGSDATTDPVEYTKTHLSVYPSNADILYLGKAGSGTDEDDIGRYDPKTMAKNAFGTTPAPKGKFILNAFDQDRNSIVSGATSIKINNRPRAVAFHNGRVFYAGVNALGESGNVYYSRSLTSIKDIGKCYQDNDPTAEEFNELLATDGGLLKIPDCGNILRLQEGRQGIVVFASNGVWEISGENGRFAADNLFVRKVTNLGCISRESVIDADGNFFYFSESGIVGSASDQVTGNLNMDVITRDNIQTGYLSIGGPQRQNSRGAYIRADKKLVWLYSTDSLYDTVTDRFKYNGVLIFDQSLGAFYKYRISDHPQNYCYVSGVLESDSVVLSTVQEDVTENGVVVTANGVAVTVGVTSTSTDSQTTTMLLQTVYPGTYSTVGLNYSLFSSKKFRDWFLIDFTGALYDSFIETGYELGGEAMLDKQPKYVHTYMSKTPKHSQTGNYYNIADNTSTSETITGIDLTSFSTIPKTEEGQSVNILFIPSSNGTQFWSSTGSFTDWSLRTMSPAYEVNTTAVTGTTAPNTASNSFNAQWSTDGTKMMECGGGSARGVNVTQLSTPYDLTTQISTQYVIYSSTYKLNGQSPYGGIFSPDGTTIILSVSGYGWTDPVNYGYGLIQLGMTVPYDLTTLFDTGYRVDFKNTWSATDYLSGGTDPYYHATGDICWNSDGTQILIGVGYNSSARVYSMSLGSPYTLAGGSIINTANYHELGAGWGGSVNNPRLVANDTKLYVAGNYNGAVGVQQYDYTG